MPAGELNLLQLWLSQIIKRTLGIGTAISILTLILCYLFAIRISRPIINLSEAAKEIAGGRFDIRLQGISPFPEVQTLLNSFDAMTVALELSQADLQSRLAELTTLNEVATKVNFASTTEEVLRVIIEKSVELMRVSGGRIYLLQEEPQLLCSAVELGEAPGDKTVSPATSSGIISKAFEEMTTQIQAPGDSATSTSGMLCFPLLIAQQALGVMVLAGRPEPFQASELSIGTTLAAQAAMTIEKSRLYELSVHDGLTHLYVHRYFQLALENEIRRTRRYGSQCALILIDVDHFKNFNDTWGHQAGDKVLKSVAAKIKETVRTVDVPARYGGEEFAVILPETGLEPAKLVSERLRQRVADLEISGNEEVLRVTVSLGLAVFPGSAQNKLELIRAADKALYAAKHAGRNRVMVAERFPAGESD